MQCDSRSSALTTPAYNVIRDRFATLASPPAPHPPEDHCPQRAAPRTACLVSRPTVVLRTPYASPTLSLSSAPAAATNARAALSGCPRLWLPPGMMTAAAPVPHVHGVHRLDQQWAPTEGARCGQCSVRARARRAVVRAARRGDEPLRERAHLRRYTGDAARYGEIKCRGVRATGRERTS